MRISDWSSDVCASDLWVVITRDGAEIFDKDNNPVERPVTISGVTGELISKGNHRHYMLKEIYERPVVVAQTLRSYLRRMEDQVSLPIPDFDLGSIRRDRKSTRLNSSH